MSEPWNSPGCWSALLTSLWRRDSPLQLHLASLPTLIGWGVTFLRNARRATFERNTVRNAHLALYSLAVMESLRTRTGFDPTQVTLGSLKVFRSHAALEHALHDAHRLSEAGLKSRALSPAEAIALEPALAGVAQHLAGAIHYPDDEVADAYRFCVEMARQAQTDGVMFRFDTRVTALERTRNSITAVRTEQGPLVADRYVIAAGSYSTPLLRTCGIDLPVRPAKGYSITLSPRAGSPRLRTALVDDGLHAVAVPLGGVIRVAGTAEFADYDESIRPARIANLGRLMRELLPAVQYDTAHVSPWCGLRAMSADGVPIIGDTAISNLFLNTGHGHLGWTMAAGSAQLLADMLSAQPIQIDASPYSPTRFRT
jgi:D-amino-acid dehydrogenase